MRTMAASAAASSRTTSGPGTASPKPCASRKGAIHSKPHSSGRTMRFSSRVVSRVSQAYIQRAYQSLNMNLLQFYQRGEWRKMRNPARAADVSACACLRARRWTSRRNQPAQAEQREQRNDSLRDDAIEAPDLKNVSFDIGEMQREAQPEDGGDEEQNAPPRQRQYAERQIAGDADGRHGDVEDDRVNELWLTMPQSQLLVDGAGLGCRWSSGPGAPAPKPERPREREWQ